MSFAAQTAKAACAAAGDVLNFDATPFFGKTGNRSDGWRERGGSCLYGVPCVRFPSRHTSRLRRTAAGDAAVSRRTVRGARNELACGLCVKMRKQRD